MLECDNKASSIVLQDRQFSQMGFALICLLTHISSTRNSVADALSHASPCTLEASPSLCNSLDDRARRLQDLPASFSCFQAYRLADPKLSQHVERLRQEETLTEYLLINELLYVRRLPKENIVFALPSKLFPLVFKFFNELVSLKRDIRSRSSFIETAR